MIFFPNFEILKFKMLAAIFLKFEMLTVFIRSLNFEFAFKK
jgi:hypothetical protein